MPTPVCFIGKKREGNEKKSKEGKRRKRRKEKAVTNYTGSESHSPRH
jgi:hypothetical protein